MKNPYFIAALIWFCGFLSGIGASLIYSALTEIKEMQRKVSCLARIRASSGEVWTNATDEIAIYSEFKGSNQIEFGAKPTKFYERKTPTE
jgi:tetrahydromethanopterin S-methyltransferase subunit D